MAPVVSPYGSWKSPITAERVAAGEIGLEQIRLDGDAIYWIERRSQEGGRKVIVRRSANGQMHDLTPIPLNARTRVHEYGGGDYAVLNGTIVFSNFTDQRLYLLTPGSEPKPLTPDAPLRYADGQLDPRRNVFLCVREDHSAEGEAINTIVRVDLNHPGQGRVLVSGNDFYSSPHLSPDGSVLAWLTWNHPNMPWDGTELWVGELNGDGSVRKQRRVAGGSDESICQPEWSPDGVLHFVSDRPGWWNLYRWREHTVEPLCPMDAEFAEPQWVFGGSLYGFQSVDRIVCSYIQNGHSYLALLNTATRALNRIDLPYTIISQVRVGHGRLVFIGASSTETSAIVSLDLASGDWRVLHRSRESQVDAGYLSPPRAIE
ncbi:MAG TPA: S9 family peptidase, partial [Candidatus Binatia bacterium]